MKMITAAMERAASNPRAVAAASALFYVVPLIGDRIVGSDSPLYLRARWHPSSTRPEHLGLIRFPGDPEAEDTPRDWHRIGVLVVSRAVLQERQALFPAARQAAAYALGNSLMVAPLPPGHEFGAIDDRRCGIGTRVGDKALLAAAGLYFPDGSFLPLHEGFSLYNEPVLDSQLESEHPELSFV